MYILNFDRPKEALQTHHPAGTSVTLQLEYSEMILIEHALCEYKDQGHLKDEDDLFFYWQFHALRDILKQGAPTSWIAQHYKMLFPKKDEFDEYIEEKAKEQEKENKGNGKGKA